MIDPLRSDLDFNDDYEEEYNIRVSDYILTFIIKYNWMIMIQVCSLRHMNIYSRIPHTIRDQKLKCMNFVSGNK